MDAGGARGSFSRLGVMCVSLVSASTNSHL
jgi:hypothetical protein